MLLHASVVDLFSPIQHINERNDLSKATSYSYVESEIAPWRNTARSTCFFMLFWTCMEGWLWPGLHWYPVDQCFLGSWSSCPLWSVALRYKSLYSCGHGCQGWIMRCGNQGFGLWCCAWAFEQAVRFPHELSWTYYHQEQKGCYIQGAISSFLSICPTFLSSISQARDIWPLHTQFCKDQ